MPEFTMERARNLALGSIAVLNAVATVVSFGESYAGLFRWATEHGVVGFWGGVWPLMVDLMILVAESGLFVAHHDKWKLRHKAWLWFVMFIALGVSTSANTGHVHSTDWLSHLTAALAPVALMFATTVGFGVMKRTFIHKPVIAKAVSEVSQDEVKELRAQLEKALTEKPSQALTRSSERVHVGSQPWIEASQERASQIASQPLTETSQPVAETQPDAPEMTDPRLSQTMVKLGFKATEKSYTKPPDRREGLTPTEMRVRDMYDLDPDIAVNAIAKNLGISWQTAKNHLEATKEARGITE